MNYKTSHLAPEINTENYYKKAQNFFSEIASNWQANFPVYNQILESKELEQTNKVAEQIKNNFECLVVFGIGASITDPKSITSINKDPSFPVLFCESIEPVEYEKIFKQIDVSKTAFLIISKSGKTIETMAQSYLCLEILANNNIKDIAKHLFVITDDSDNPLYKLAKENNATLLHHPKEVGGRYASLSAVGLLPAIVSGLDGEKIIQGAKDFIEQDYEQAISGASLLYEYYSKGYNLLVLFTYINRLNDFCQWYRQIWAESLGKSGKGMTPLTAIGPLDQHSQLQLYLDGPKDKFFTLFHSNKIFKSSVIKGDFINIDEFQFLKNKSLGDILSAEQKATKESLIKSGRPVREFSFDGINEHAIGRLIMQIMLETVLFAKFIEVSPYGQPAVEDGKKKTIEYLSK